MPTRTVFGVPGSTTSVASPDTFGQFFAKSSPWIDIKHPDYGAKGDGVTDDTQAIKDAIAAAGTAEDAPPIFIPEGVYIVSSTITVPSYTVLFGVGPSSIVKVKDNAAAGFSVFQVTAAGANGIRFRDFAIHGNATNNTQTIHGIDFTVATSAAIYNAVQDMLIKEMTGNGIRAAGTAGLDNSKIVNSIIRDCSSHNIYLTTASLISIIGCTVRSAKTTNHGIMLDGAGVLDVDIVGCRIQDNNTHGIFATQGNRVHVKSCVVTHNAQIGIYFDRIAWGSIVGNSLDQNGRTGILVDGSSGGSTCQVIVAGNAVRLSGRHGINLADASHAMVVGNHVHDNGTETNVTFDNIAISGNADNNLISGNLVRKGSQTNKPAYGIDVEGASANANVIQDNDLMTAGETANLNDSGTDSIIRNNRGWATENNVLSGTFAIDATGLKTVTIAHGLSYTPSKEHCQLTVLEETNVDDWAYNLLKVDSVDATNVTAKINISTASATGTATARLGLRAQRH